MTAARPITLLSRMVEGVGIALDSIRVQQGARRPHDPGRGHRRHVVIAMGSAITGINRSITGDPRVRRPQDLLRAALLRRRARRLATARTRLSPWRRMPWLTTEEAELIRQLPAVRDVNIGEYTSGPVSYEGVNLTQRARSRASARPGSR